MRNRDGTARCFGMSAGAVGVGVVDAVAAANRLVLSVVTAWAGRQVIGRSDTQLVATVRALVGAGGRVAAARNGICHHGPPQGLPVIYPANLELTPTGLPVARHA